MVDKVTVSGMTKARMLTEQAMNIVGAALSGDNLILTRRDNSTINVGSVRGAAGFTPTLRGTSSTSLAVGTGSKVFAVSGLNNVAFPVNSIVRAIAVVDPTDYMVGMVTASTTTSVTINVTEIGGSGTFNSWVLTPGSYKGADGVLTGSAGGDLTGNYPNPQIAAGLYLPVGAILDFGGDTAPSGFLLCRGQAVLRSAEPNLFAVIGTRYGTTASDNFLLPPPGRVYVGLDSTQTEFDTLGETGGEKTHLMTVAELAAHSHTGTTSSNTHGHTIRQATGTGANSANVAMGNTAGVTDYSTSSDTHSHTFTTNTVGDNTTPFNVLSPYVVVNKIIRR